MLGDLDETSRLLDGFRYRFLHQHMDAAVEEDLGYFEMRRGRDDDTDGIDGPDELAIVADGVHAQLHRDALARLVIDIDHRNQIRARDLRKLLGVELSQIAYAYDGRSQRRRCSFYHSISCPDLPTIEARAKAKAKAKAIIAATGA